MYGVELDEIIRGAQSETFVFKVFPAKTPVRECSLFYFVNGDKLNPARALTRGEFASGYEFAVEVIAAVNVEIVAALAGGNEPAVSGVKVEGAGHFTGGELPCAF